MTNATSFTLYIPNPLRARKCKFCFVLTDDDDTDTVESSPLQNIPPDDTNWQPDRIPLSCVCIH